MAVKINSILVRLTEQDLDNILKWRASHGVLLSNEKRLPTTSEPLTFNLICRKKVELEKLNS